MVFDDRADGSQRSSHASFVDHVSEYIPGQFYRRELPCILRLLDEHALAPEYILIDGYVYLDGHSRPGLGKYLYDVLQHKVKIIGIPKNPSMSITREYEVYRGRSRRPLYVTCAGEQLSVCKRRVETMSGAHRLRHCLNRSINSVESLLSININISAKSPCHFISLVEVSVAIAGCR